MENKRARVVIIGGGFGGLFTALDLGSAGDVTLISDSDHFLHTPMLYEYLSGEVEEWHIAPKYKELLDDDVKLIHDEVTSIDLDARRITLKNQPATLEYDVLVLAVGGVSNFSGVQGAAEHAIPFRKIADADLLRRRMVEALDRVAPDLPPQDTQSALTFAVVGAGASGVELSTKMADLLRDAFQRRALRGEPRVLVIEMGDIVVPGMGDDIREFVEDALRESHVEVHTLTRVVRVTEKTLVFEHNGTQTEIDTAAVVWVGGVRVNPVIENLEVEKTKRGLLLVNPTLQLPSHENVFALGDVAFYKDAAPILAGTAQLAFQQAGLAARNIKALLAGDELKTKHFEELGEAVSLGTERAAVLAGGKAFGGPLARQARFALYTARLPTWQHRLRVGASWFFDGTAPRPLLPLGLQR
ncbi:MAG TPA: NAD(P)/FAD-dependent oxidoreductase [Pyrinomonadaceae bacterium]|jgi:NADH dehydrogenase|nr:NAD(P)/FAD-dependent oxidoreductase [Pyrinomonadaceae bacterium]